jgi:hypothetical protein
MATLEAIRDKVRRVTGRYEESQLTTDQLDEYINTFYFNDMPEHLRLIRQQTTYEFVTEPNVAVYPLPQDYITLEQPFYVDGYQGTFQMSPQTFWSIWPNLSYIQQLSTGNGSQGPYTGTFSSAPLLAGSVMIAAGDENFQDDGEGTLTGSLGGSGTVDYLTGAASVTFATSLSSGTVINGHAVYYQPARPWSLLYFNNELTLRPVPDQAYTVTITAYRKPTAALVDADQSPELEQWWELLAYGAALKIFADFGQFEELAKYTNLFENQMTLVQRRTLVQLATQRVPTRYSDGGIYGNNWNGIN